MAKFLITGVAGTTGSHLVRLCLEQGDEVVGVDDFFRGTADNLEEILSHPHFTFYQMDFRDYIDRHAADGLDGVYHLAAVVPTRYFYEAPELTYEVNCHGAYLIFKWALAGGVPKFVNASSSEIYGHPQEIPLRENSPSLYDAVETTPRWSYAHGKILTEYLMNAQKDDIAVCHLRYANVYGPYDLDDNHVLPYILARILKNEPMTLAKNAREVRRSFLFSPDAAEATRLAMLHMQSGAAYNIGNPDETTVQELFELARDVVREKFSLKYAHEPAYTLERAGDPTRRVLDIARAREHLGFRPRVALREGLAETAVWMRRQMDKRGEQI